MGHISFLGLSDTQIIELFRFPLDKIQTSELEGNRLFEVQLVFNSERILRIHSEIAPIGDRDEICVLFFAYGEAKDYPIEIDISDIGKSINSVHRIVGEFDREESCECGLTIETGKGLISILSGSFPGSLNVICPRFQQGLLISSFPKFKYYHSKMAGFAG